MEPLWWITFDGDDYCRELYERHYSNKRQSLRERRKTKLFVGPGTKLVLRTFNADALFVWRKFIDDARDSQGERQSGINCSVFRNESSIQSSVLISQADAIADFLWPRERHYTYVDAEKIRSKNPGFCFIRAGWKRCGKTRSGLIVLEKENGHGDDAAYEGKHLR